MATPNALFVSGAILTAAQQNDFPFGLVTSTTLASNFSTTSASPVDITGFTVTFTALASRKYLIVALFNFANSGANVAQVYLNKGATALTEAYGAPVSSSVASATIFAIDTPGAGSVTYKGQVSTAGGTETVYGTATRASIAARMFVLDIGTA